VVGYHGTVYIAHDTGRVLRIVKSAEIPGSFPVRSSEGTLDYDLSQVAGREYLLPLRAEMMMSTSTTQFRNEVDFKDYRKFSAESTLTFEEPGRSVAH
jgi:hypothetical protein